MTPNEAAKLLEVPVDVTPEQLEARFLDLRSKLETKVAKAPTPGLQAKYREAIAAITTAFETLSLAADGSALPLVKRQPAASHQPSVEGNTVPAPSSPASSIPATASKPGRGKEFIVVALVAVGLLVAGGWFVLKTRAESAEKARLESAVKREAEQKALAEKTRQTEAVENSRREEEVRRQAGIAEQARLATEEKLRQEKQAQQTAAIRTSLAELKIAWEATEQQARTAERRVSDLRSDLRNTPATTADGRRLQAELGVQQEFSDWLNSQLARHPARVARVQAEELVSARQLDEAAATLQKAVEAQQRLDQEIAAQPARLEARRQGVLLLELERPDDTWTALDAFGRSREGRGSGRLEKMPAGPGTLTLSRAGWPPLTERFLITAGAESPLAIRWRGADLTIVANVPGAIVYEQDRELGPVPLTLEDRPPGAVAFEVRAPKYQPARVTATLQANQALQLEAVLAPPTAAQALAELMKPHRGKWKVDSGRFDRRVRYEDYLTVSDDGLTLIHHATNGPARGTHTMPLTLLDAGRGLVLAPRWIEKGRDDVGQVYRVKDDHIDWLDTTARKIDGRWILIMKGTLLNQEFTVDQLPPGEDTPPLYWRYLRAN